MNLHSVILYSFGYLMDTSQNQLGDLGRKIILPLLKVVNNGKIIMMIWILYLSILSNNFWEQKDPSAILYNAQNSIVLTLLYTRSNTVWKETMTLGVCLPLIFSYPAKLFLLVKSQFSHLWNVTCLAWCLLPINGATTIFLYSQYALWNNFIKVKFLVPSINSS